MIGTIIENVGLILKNCLIKIKVLVYKGQRVSQKTINFVNICRC